MKQIPFLLIITVVPTLLCSGSATAIVGWPFGRAVLFTFVMLFALFAGSIAVQWCCLSEWISSDQDDRPNF